MLSLRFRAVVAHVVAHSAISFSFTSRFKSHKNRHTPSIEQAYDTNTPVARRIV